MKLSGKVWSDHGMTWLHFRSIPRNRAMPRCATRERGLLWFRTNLLGLRPNLKIRHGTKIENVVNVCYELATSIDRQQNNTATTFTSQCSTTGLLHRCCRSVVSITLSRQEESRADAIVSARQYRHLANAFKVRQRTFPIKLDCRTYSSRSSIVIDLGKLVPIESPYAFMQLPISH